LAATGVGAGDEVIIPPFTFVATFEAIVGAGAVPVFSEIDHTLCLDPNAIEKVLSPRTKAVMPVHMCGSMARIDEIKSFCDKKGLILIEDVAQSVGATYNGKALGTFGHMGTFSFDPVKTITCGEGGAVITDDEHLYHQADYHADHGHDHLQSDRGLEDHPILGTNYRISELHAAVGLGQLMKLDSIIEKQRSHKKIIKEALENFAQITFREIPDESGDSATFLTFLLPEADLAQKVTQNLFPNASLDKNERTMGSEDMAYMMEDIPGCYFFIGSANAQKGLDAKHHHPKFDFDETALTKGAALMSAVILDLLS
jgi:8-amino-3,8-dideoxy-alpha-D-manno-octulosonate transaminase